MSTASVLLSEKLAATLAEAAANLELVNKEVNHEEWKQLHAEEEEVNALEKELEELEQARKEEVKTARLKRRTEKARLLAESGYADDALVSNEAMRELEDVRHQLDVDRWSFENDNFQLEVFQAQLGGKDSITVEDKTRMIAARDLNIVLGDNPDVWKWTSVPETRYAVAELLESTCFQIYGRLYSSSLFPYIKYGAYFVYKFTNDSYGFSSNAEGGAGIHPKVEIGYIHLEAKEDQTENETAHIFPKTRLDGWMEVQLGNFFVEGDEEVEIHLSMIEIWSGILRKGLIVLGIELRPI